MSAENAWRIAMGAGASTYRGDGEWDTFGEFERTLLALPMPPAFRAEVEAEAEELRGMLVKLLRLANGPGHIFREAQVIQQFGEGPLAEAHALLSRLEAKGEEKP